MLVLLTILLLVMIVGIIKPFQGFSRKQFAVASAVIFIVCLVITPVAEKSATTVAESKPITSSQRLKPEANATPEAPKVVEMESDGREPAGQENLTGPQNNAVRSAQQYLSMTGFSRDGLIQQLSSDAGEGYSISDSTAAVDSLSVDWNENAEKSARQYLDMTGFSCKGLIEQLSSSAGDKYTVDQATYGARQAGAC